MIRSGCTSAETADDRETESRFKAFLGDERETDLESLDLEIRAS